MFGTTIKERLDLIVKELRLSGRAFEKECGLANGSYSSIGNGVGADKLNKILTRYTQISADWLLTGKGEMFREELLENAVIASQQNDISRLIAELERIGSRTDRMLGIIERERESGR